jgi:hypothetical protein
MTLAFDIIMKSKHKCKIDNNAKKSCSVLTLGEKINITEELRNDVSTAAVGLTFR